MFVVFISRTASTKKEARELSKTDPPRYLVEEYIEGPRGYVPRQTDDWGSIEDAIKYETFEQADAQRRLLARQSSRAYYGYGVKEV